jgi:hypothetical protein
VYKGWILLLSLLLQPMLAAGELRDPTRPPVHDTGVMEELPVIYQDMEYRLSGILSGPGGNSAILNGMSVRAGDEVAGGRVVRIEPGFVEIEGAGGSVRIELLPMTVKRPTEAPAGGKE